VGRTKRRKTMMTKKPSGFTLIEIAIATLVLGTALISMLGLFTRALALARQTGSFTIANFSAEREMELICANSYDTIRATYTNNGALLETTFDPSGEDDNLNGMLDAGEDANGNGALDSPFEGSGTIYAQETETSAASAVMRIKVVVCYMQDMRMIGEDVNFNGRLEAGENTIDATNAELDSPCQFETVVAQ
jgi:type II secretory pathway pseudopilin PulG